MPYSHIYVSFPNVMVQNSVFQVDDGLPTTRLTYLKYNSSENSSPDNHDSDESDQPKNTPSNFSWENSSSGYHTGDLNTCTCKHMVLCMYTVYVHVCRLVYW